MNVFSPTDVWIPLEAWLGVDADTRRLLKPRDARALQVMGLLRDGVTKRQAQADLDAIAARFERVYADATAGRSLVAWSARDDDRRKRVGLTAVALVLAGLVLLVACTNGSTMLLARAESRRRDTPIRLALGASRWRLLRMLIAEAFLVALGASLLGLLLAHWLLGLTPALKPITPLPIVSGFDVNRSVVLYTMFLALATTVICALVPMWQSGARDLSGALRSDASGYTCGGRFARSRFAVLVVVQIAVTQMLLCGAALLLRSYQNTLAARPGFDPDKSVLMVRLASSADRDRPRVGYYLLAEQLAALPGVRAASFIHNPPLSGFGDAVLRVERGDGADAAPLGVSASTVGTGYFALVGTRVLHGRAFERHEVDQSRSVVVNETFVRRVFPLLPNASEAIGRPVRTGTRTLEIIGVVEDGKYGSLREAPQPHAYRLAPASSRAGTTLLVETSGRPENLAAPIRDAVRAADPDLWIAGMTTLEEHTRLARILDEFGAVVTGAMGALSLVLAAIGLYGLTAFWVRRRMRECGVRMALGATPADVIALMQTQAMRPVVIGMVLGLTGGLLLGRVLSSVLFGVRAYDPIALGGGMLFTFLVSFSATRIPARRCARVQLGSLLKDA